MKFRSLARAGAGWLAITLALALVIIALGTLPFACKAAFGITGVKPTPSHVTGVHYAIRTITHEYGYKKCCEDSMLVLGDLESTDRWWLVCGRYRGEFQGVGWPLDIGRNTRKALKYIGRRYGDPCAALRAWHGGY